LYPLWAASRALFKNKLVIAIKIKLMINKKIQIIIIKNCKSLGESNIIKLVIEKIDWMNFVNSLRKTTICIII